MAHRNSIFTSMVVSEKVLKWAMRFYPPLLFQRIWVKRFEKDFTGVEVKIFKSLLNINHNRSIFGGTIFSASDPFYALLFDQTMRKRGFKVRIWLKSASINYVRPGRTNLYFSIRLTDEDIQEAVVALTTIGKFVKAFPIQLKDRNGVICAEVMNEVYIRNLHAGEDQITAY